jgi:hypothetical protein
VTFAVKGYDPESAVIPVMVPLEAPSWIPDGNARVAILLRYGLTPPVAESVAI